MTVKREYERLEQYIEETVELSPMFSGRFRELSDDRAPGGVERETRHAEPHAATVGDAAGSTLVAVAGPSFRRGVGAGSARLTRDSEVAR